MDKRTQELLSNLEDLYVKEFRTLQQLIAVTKKERDALPKNEGSALMRLVEEKESILDQLGIMEDTGRMLLQELAARFNIQSERTTLRELLPHFPKENAERIDRLSDGIRSLVSQAKDMNYGNQAMATSMLEWFYSAQTFLLSMAQPPAGYRPPGANPNLELGAMSGMEHRA